MKKIINMLKAKGGNILYWYDVIGYFKRYTILIKMPDDSKYIITGDLKTILFLLKKEGLI